MDFYITKVFRSICDDVQMLIDVYQITPHCQPVGRPFLECFTEGLAAVVEKESTEIIPALHYSDSFTAPRIDYASNKTSNNELSWKMSWEFVHSIILQFCAEELSQYPFWAAKVALSTTDINAWHLEQSVFSAFWKLLSRKFESGGLFTLFHGCVPYVVAAYFYNIAHVELLFRKFFVIVVSSIPRTPSAVARFKELRTLREQPPTKNSHMFMPHRADYYSAPILTADPAAHPQVTKNPTVAVIFPHITSRSSLTPLLSYHNFFSLYSHTLIHSSLSTSHPPSLRPSTHPSLPLHYFPPFHLPYFLLIAHFHALSCPVLSFHSCLSVCL